jgi:hypothetical protein
MKSYARITDPTSLERISADVAALQLEENTNRAYGVSLPPLSLSFWQFKAIGQKMGWFERMWTEALLPEPEPEEDLPF